MQPLSETSRIQHSLSDNIQTISRLRSELEDMFSVWNSFTSYAPVQFIMLYLYKLYIIFIAIPLFRVYTNGPSLGGYSPFWAGKSLPDICASLTKVDSQFWSSSNEKMQECELILFREYHAFMVGIMWIVYVVAMGRVLCWILGRIRRASHMAYKGIVQTFQNSAHRQYEERIVTKNRSGHKIRSGPYRSSSQEQLQIPEGGVLTKQLNVSTQTCCNLQPKSDDDY